MSKNIFLTMCFLSINNLAFASQHDNAIKNAPSSASDIQPQEILGSTIVLPEGPLTGKVVVPYRYQSEADLKQTLGYLHSNSQFANNASDSAADISPQEDLVSPEPSKPTKPKKTIKRTAKPQQIIRSSKQTSEPTPATKRNVSAIANTTVATVPKSNPSSTTPEVDTPDVSKVIAQETAEQDKMAIAPSTSEATQKSAQSNSLEGRTILEFNQTDVDLSNDHKTALLELAGKLKEQNNFMLKLQSYASVASSDIAEARRISLQRAIKARKFLIENDINPNNISVNAVEDNVNKSNKIQLTMEKND